MRSTTTAIDRDFGGVLVGSASSVAEPKSARELSALVQGAGSRGERIVVRGGGMGQSGQSLGRNALVVVTRHLGGLALDPDAGVVTCGPAVTWRELIRQSAPAGWMPEVVPLNLDLTVGGTLSAGGFGSTSHRVGPAVEHVCAATVVTGAGEIVVASGEQRPDVLGAMLGGVGRFGIFCNLSLRLRRAQKRVRTVYMLFDDLEANLRAQRILTERGCTHLEGFCAAAVVGGRKSATGRGPFAEWFFGLHAGVEFSDVAPSRDEITDGLSPYRVLHVEDDTSLEHAARYDFRFDAMRRSGALEQLHPWFETMIPLVAVPDFVPSTLSEQPMWLGDGHRMTVVAPPKRATSMAMPASPSLAFALLPMGVPCALRDPTLAWLRRTDRRARSFGAKRYLSGWIPDTSVADWQAHFGDRFDGWQKSKLALDPASTLSSLLFEEADATSSTGRDEFRPAQIGPAQRHRS